MEHTQSRSAATTMLPLPAGLGKGNNLNWCVFVSYRLLRAMTGPGVIIPFALNPSAQRDGDAFSDTLKQ